MDNTQNRELPNPDAAFPRNALVDETAKLQATGQHGIGGLGAPDIAQDQRSPISTTAPSTYTHPSSLPDSSSFSASNPTVSTSNNLTTSSTTTQPQETTASHLIHDAEEAAAQALHAAQNVASSLFGAAASYLPSAQQTKDTANVAAAKTQETAASTAQSVSQSLPTQDQVRGAAVESSNIASNAANDVASRLPSVQQVRDTSADAIRSVANAIPSPEQVQQSTERPANTSSYSSIQPVRETTHAPSSGLTTTSASVSPSSTLPHSNQPGSNNPFTHSSQLDENAPASSPHGAGQQVGGMAAVISDSIARAAEESPATSAGRSELHAGHGIGSGRGGEDVASRPGEVNQVGGLAGVIADDVAEAAKHSTSTSVGDVPLASSQRTAPSVTNSFAQSLPSQQQVQGTLNQAAQSANETASQAANTVAQSLPSENQVRGAANEGINQASNAAAQVASVLPSVQDVRNTTANAIRAAADLLPTGEQVEQTAESVTRQTRNAAESVSQQARAATQPVVQEARSVAREVTQPERVLAAPPTLPTRESSMETPGTVKILDRQVIGGPSPSTGENVYPRPVDQESVSSRSAPVSESLYAKPPTTVTAAEDNAAFRSAVGTQGQLTPGGITPGQELPGGWGHTNVVRPETTIYEDAERLLKSVGQVAYSSIPHSLIERFSNHSIQDDHPVQTTTNTLPHQSTTSTKSIIPTAQDVQNAVENAKAVIASHLPSGRQVQATADQAAYNVGKAAGAVSVTGQQAAQQTREATAQVGQSAAAVTEQARQSAAEGIRSTANALPSNEQIRQPIDQARETAAQGIRATADALPSDEQIRQSVPAPSQIIPTSTDKTNNQSLASTEIPSVQSIAHSATDAVYNAAAYLGLSSPTKTTSSGEKDITVSTGLGGSPASISQQNDASKGGFAATISDEVARAAQQSEATSAGSVPLTHTPHVHAPATSSSHSQSAPSSEGLERNEGVEEESLVGGGGLAATIADDVAHAAEESPATSAGSVPLSSHPHVHPPAPVSRDSDFEQAGSVSSISRSQYEQPSSTSRNAYEQGSTGVVEVRTDEVKEGVQDVDMISGSDSRDLTNTRDFSTQDNTRDYSQGQSQSYSSQSVDLPSSLSAAKTSEELSAAPEPSEVERISTQGEHGLIWDDASGKYMHRRDLEASQSQGSRGGDERSSSMNDDQSREARGELVEERKESGGRGYEQRDVERAPEAQQQSQYQSSSQFQTTTTGSDGLVNLGLGAPVIGGGSQGPLTTITTQSSSSPSFGLPEHYQSSTTGASSPSSTYSSVPVTSVQDSSTSFSNVDVPSTRESESALDRADAQVVESKAHHDVSDIQSSRASAAGIAPGTVDAQAPTTPASVPAFTSQSSSSAPSDIKESRLVDDSQIPSRDSVGEQERAREEKEIAEIKAREAKEAAATPSTPERKSTPPSHASSVNRTEATSSPSSSHKKSLSEKFKGFLHKG